VDTHGKLFVSDEYRNSVKEIVPVNGVVCSNLSGPASQWDQRAWGHTATKTRKS
jgi:hypothetical protein